MVIAISTLYLSVFSVLYIDLSCCNCSGITQIHRICKPLRLQSLKEQLVNTRRARAFSLCSDPLWSAKATIRLL